MSNLMGNFRSRFFSLSIIFILSVVLPACNPRSTAGEVVIYTSVDQNFSSPILDRFEEQSGIKVLPVFDVEAAKTTGLVNRLIAEKSRPQADVFWNGEFAQTILLKEEGALAPYVSPNVVDIPDQYLDPEGYWAGFAGRARVLLVNTDLVSPGDYPQSIFDLLEPQWPAEQIGIAYPLFGTTATQAAAIYTALGAEKGREFYRELHDRGISVVAGNSVVRDLVASGQLMFGLTDTDDACGAVSKGAPVVIIFPDQDGMGTLVIPNTVALINNGPHPQEARALIDFLLSSETEGLLIEAGWSHVSLRPVDVKPGCIETSDIKGMDVSLIDVFGQLTRIKEELAEIYIQ